jgi:hypothetical protein
MKDSPAENAKPRRKKLRIVLIAAIIGAGIFITLIETLNPTVDYLLKTDNKIAFRLADAISSFSESPMEFVEFMFGPNTNPLISYGLTGSVFFAVPAAFWQFIVKRGKVN